MSKTEMIGTRVIFQRDLILHPVSPEKYSVEVKEPLSNG